MANDDITIGINTDYDAAAAQQAQKDLEKLQKEEARRAEAEKKAQEQAKRAADEIEVARRRELASMEELNEELQDYRDYLAQAEQSGNQTQRLQALKNIQDLERRIAALRRAQEQAAAAARRHSQQLADQAEKARIAAEKAAAAGAAMQQGGAAAGKGFQLSGYGMLQVAQFADDAQYGLRGVMNNIPSLVMGLGGGMGLAGALSVAVLGFSKLYDWLTKTAQEEEAQAKKRAERAQEFRRQINETHNVLLKNEADKRAEEMQTRYDDYVKGITRQFKDQTAELDKQIRMREQAAARRAGIDTAKAEIEQIRLKNLFDAGDITEDEYNERKFIIDQNLQEKLLRQQLKTADQNYGTKVQKAIAAEQQAGAMEAQQAKLQNFADALPDDEVMRAIIEKIATKGNYINKLNTDLSELDAKIEKNERRYRSDALNPWNRDALGTFIERQKKEREEILRKRGEAAAERTAADDQIKNIISLFAEADIIFTPFDDNGNVVHSTKEYLKAVATLRQRLKELAPQVEAAQKSADDAQLEAEQAEDAAWDIQDQIDLSQKKNEALRLGMQIRNAKIKAQREQEAEKQEKQTRDEAQKDADGQIEKQQAAAIKTNRLKLGTDPRTGRRWQTAETDAADQAYDLASKVITAGLKDDGTVDKAELSNALKEAEKTLKEQGADSTKILNFVSSQLIDFAIRLNNLKAEQETLLQQAVAKKNRELEREKNRWKNYLR